MTTPTIKLIDITSDLSAQPTGADCDSQFASTGSATKPAVNAPKPAAASGEAPGGYRGDVLQRIARLALAAPWRTIIIRSIWRCRSMSR